MTLQAKVTPVQIYPYKEGMPAALVDAQGMKWKWWTTGFQGKPGGIPADRFQVGVEYLVGYKPGQYNGVEERTITSVIDGQSKAIPKVLQKPVYRNQAAPSERISIETQAIFKSLASNPNFDLHQPIDSGALAMRLNEIAKGVCLSVLHNGTTECADDMNGDNIPY